MLTYFLIFIAVGLVTFGGTKLFQLLKITKDDRDNILDILEVINLLNEKFDWKYSGELSTICSYTKEAVEYIYEVEGVTDRLELIKSALDMTKEMCKLSGVVVDEQLEEIIEKFAVIIIDRLK